ncbi:MAG: BREX-1 system adenine-specific DNA-methyltransferase PglX [Syntrophales bacterium]|nr:BREX-1 system adenine-specific DNA-methyltransferase PglX [Syntrophales bacterium]
MNLNALKNFAPNVRRQLIEAVGRKLDFVLTGDTPDLREKAKQRMSIKGKAEKDRPGLIERVAYTWFNRLAALRFLDARGWHPFLCRVITPVNEEETQPEILKLTRNGALPTELGPFTDAVRINDLLDGRIPSADPQGEVYRHLVLAACRYYHNLMPFLFEALDDETELLLPDDLLTEHSVAQGFRSAITDGDCAEVEIIGWLYQFYIAEKKDQVMARKSAVPTEDIPAVTQLFTPHWIVRYLVENSLGRLWLLNRPGSRLRKHMPYYIEGEPDTGFLKITKPEEIRLLDPATGSGHMLTYSFDLLYLIYEEEGHAPSEIPGLILRHNLFGLEICPRATQLAQFSLVCKAREKSRVAFRNPVQPQVMCLEDVEIASQEMTDFLRLPSLCELFTEKVLRQIHQFRENTSTFGSLIQPVLTAAEMTTLKSRLAMVSPGADLLLNETHRKVLCAIDQAEMLSQRYHVVVANPPYMGSGGMNGRLGTWAKDNYPDSKSDLFAMFIERNLDLVVQQGAVAMITMQSWMFLSSFEKLRVNLLGKETILSMAHLGARAFDSIGGEVVSTTAFILEHANRPEYKGGYLRLVDGDSEAEKQALLKSSLPTDNFPLPTGFFRASTADFKKIPGYPIAYWLSPTIRRAFNNKKIGDFFAVKEGLGTRDDSRFLRNFWEVDRIKIRLTDENNKWVPVDKAGGYRKWFGNTLTVMNWENNGAEIKNFEKSVPRNTQYFFKPAVSWGKVSTGRPSFRWRPSLFAFVDAAPSAFGKDLEKLVAALNSNAVSTLLKIQGGTINVTVGLAKSLPIPGVTSDGNARACIDFCKKDWDFYETSWDFNNLPLLYPDYRQQTLKATYIKLRTHWREITLEMQRLEEENNRIFIEAYGLQEELTPDVPLNEITMTCNPHYRYSDKKSEEELESLLLADTLKEFLSYAVGCMMGRYSLDALGLILANTGDTLEHYLAKVGKPFDQLTFTPDADGILPVLDGEWFEDDIVARTRDFLRLTFGEATLEENLRFIEESLGKDLRKYFLNDFSKDHVQTYKKRPIYWLFQSPKKGFSALIYLHRYTRDTVNVLLNSYLRDYLHKLRSRIEHLEHVQATSENAREKTAARKESDVLKRNLHECEEYEREIILPLAQQRIELDLDDGVKVNYLKFGKALAPIPGLAAKEEDG